VADDAIVLFINDDVQFDPDYLDRAAKLMDEKKGVLVLSKTRDPNTGEISETGVTADLRRLTFKISNSADSINCLPTRGLFAHWRDVRRIGGFHPRILPHYLSDYEYTIRAHKLGLKCESSSAQLNKRPAIARLARPASGPRSPSFFRRRRLAIPSIGHLSSCSRPHPYGFSRAF
jgi:GT2 family glycosyltransferase